MADQKLSQLPAGGNVADADLLYAVQSGSSVQVTGAQVRSGAVVPSTNDFRLTLTSGTPVTTADVTGAGTLYLTPYKGQSVATYDGGAWALHASAEISLALAATSGKNYDVFAYWSSGALHLELSAAWTNDTTRADALARQDGVWVKSADHSRRYLGTIRASGGNVTEDSAVRRFVWNGQNRERRKLEVTDGTYRWTYSGTGTFQPANNSTANRVQLVVGLQEAAVWLLACVATNNNGADWVSPGIGIDSTSANSADVTAVGAGSTPSTFPATATLLHYPQGYHYYQWLDFNNSGTASYYGNMPSGTGDFLSGLNGFVEG